MALNTSQNLIDLGADSSMMFLNDENDETLVETKSSIEIDFVGKDKRDSLDNNPFDKALKRAELLCDPFEAVAIKASENELISSNAFVKTENLLALNEYQESFDTTLQKDKNFNDLSIVLADQNLDSEHCLSSISVVSSFNSPRFFGKNFSDMSPLLIDPLVTSAGDSTVGLNRETFMSNNSNDNGTKSSREMNKAFITDVNSYDSSSPQKTRDSFDWKSKDKSRKNSLESNTPTTNMRNQLLKFSLSNSTYNSPLRRSLRGSEDGESSIFSEARSLAEMFSQITLSASPRVSEDSCDDIMSIKPNWVDSETDIDSDLELLKIPMLQEIEEQSPELISDPEIENKENKEINDAKENKPIDISKLKEKVAHCKKVAFDKDVEHLIENLKSKISECHDTGKRSEANNLLENLSDILKKKVDQPVSTQADDSVETATLCVPPNPIVRQGTFDLDKPNLLTDKREYEENTNPDSTEFSGKPMFNNSVNIETIARQVSELLGGENVGVLQANLPNGEPNSNPTYILVMNTSKHFTQPPDESIHSSPDFPTDMRPRRSLSLSSHDKRKMIPDTTQSYMGNPEKSQPITTPVRPYLSRRNSMSHTPTSQSSVRRSIYGSSRQSFSSNLGTVPQKPENKVITRTERSRSDLNEKKLKLKSSEATTRHQGPLKATVPIKKIPTVKIQTISPPVKNTARKSNLFSSTPVANNSLRVQPIACSTPAVANRRNSITPTAKQSSTRSRMSFLSATPNPRVTANPLSLQNRRRTLTQTKDDEKMNVPPKRPSISNFPVRTLKMPKDVKKTTRSDIKPLKILTSTQNRDKENNPK